MINLRAAAAILFAVLPVTATEYTVDYGKSIFAVVTHKAGLAAAFAHNHLVYPAEYKTELSVDGNDPLTAAFTLEFNVNALEVDAPDQQKRWFPAIQAAEILKDPFKAIETADRKTIKEHMLAKDQLDAEAYPTISAKLVSLKADRAKRGKTDYAYSAVVAFTVHGKTVEREMPANVTVHDDRAVIDAAGEFRFTEFGIEPYSAFGGAVRNEDRFHVLVHIEAVAAN